MPGRKMFPPKEPTRAVAELSKTFDTFEVYPDVRPMADGVVVDFTRSVQMVAMLPSAARKFARELVEAADALDKEGVSRAKDKAS